MRDSERIAKIRTAISALDSIASDLDSLDGARNPGLSLDEVEKAQQEIAAMFQQLLYLEHAYRSRYRRHPKESR
jgi:hypothetical protein